MGRGREPRRSRRRSGEGHASQPTYPRPSKPCDPVRMDYTDEELEDLATMRALRLRLRALADAKIAECEAMQPAKNWLDMTRQIKAIMAADKMIISLYSPPPRRRSPRNANATTSRPIPRLSVSLVTKCPPPLLLPISQMGRCRRSHRRGHRGNGPAPPNKSLSHRPNRRRRKRASPTLPATSTT